MHCCSLVTELIVMTTIRNAVAHCRPLGFISSVYVTLCSKGEDCFVLVVFISRNLDKRILY